MNVVFNGTVKVNILSKHYYNNIMNLNPVLMVAVKENFIQRSLISKSTN